MRARAYLVAPAASFFTFISLHSFYKYTDTHADASSLPPPSTHRPPAPNLTRTGSPAPQLPKTQHPPKLLHTQRLQAYAAMQHAPNARTEQDPAHALDPCQPPPIPRPPNHPSLAPSLPPPRRYARARIATALQQDAPRTFPRQRHRSFSLPRRSGAFSVARRGRGGVLLELAGGMCCSS